MGARQIRDALPSGKCCVREVILKGLLTDEEGVRAGEDEEGTPSDGGDHDGSDLDD